MMAHCLRHGPKLLSACRLRSIKERTFYRKDLFVAHLRGLHAADKDSFAVRHAHLFKQEVTIGQEQYDNQATSLDGETAGIFEKAKSSMSALTELIRRKLNGW